MAVYPVPTVNDTNSIFNVMAFVNNEASGGIFFPVMLLVIWAIAFVGGIAETRQASRAWIFASFISAILGIILALMNFLDKTYIYLLILMIAFGMVWIKLTNARND